MLNSILGALVVLTCGLNLYIHNYPILHGCRYDPDAAFRMLAFGDPQITGAGPHTSLRKQVDIWGNDLFLKHTASTLRKKLRPDAVFVMGDLISSQWISTPEFDERADRFGHIFGMGAGQLHNLSGNHDVGYHGEMNSERVDRYRRRYGALNYIEELAPGLRLVAINAMAVDGPPYDSEYHLEVHEFLESLPKYAGSTVLLTHIPLYKPEGICTDGPMFEYYENGSVRDQNHLSEQNSLKILNKVFGDKSGIILTGHDHEGCYSTYQYDADSLQVEGGLSGSGISEVVVRSLMGEYGGNGGLLSALPAENGYEFRFELCRFQVQHVWWVTEIATQITIFVSMLRGLVWIFSRGAI